MGPDGAMLMSEMDVGVCNFLRLKQAVVRTACFTEFLEEVRTKHFAERIGRIDGTVDQGVGDVYALWGVLSVERLTEHSAPAHRCCMGVLACVAPNRGCG